MSGQFCIVGNCFPVNFSFLISLVNFAFDLFHCLLQAKSTSLESKGKMFVFHVVT